MPLIRDFKDNLTLQTRARRDDTIRIAKILNPLTTTGANFAINQTILRASETADTLNKASFATGQGRQDLLKSAQNGAVGYASALAAILAQVPVSGTGTHFAANEVAALLRREYVTYINSTNAASEAKYSGKVFISKNNKRMKGAQTWDEQGFAGAGTSDEIGTVGISSNVQELLKKESLPVIFRIVGETNSTLLFRGFIQGISNSFNPSWTTVQYVGRGEPLYTYTNTGRTLSFGLTVPIFSEAEQHAAYQKVNSLISHTYPKYVDNLPQGTITAIRIGDYLSQYGVITSIADTVEVDVPWSSNEKDDVPVLLPQVIKLQISMNIIHYKLPQRFTGDSTDFELPFIANGLPAFK